MAAHWGWALACASLLAARGACDELIRWCDSGEFRAPEPSIRIPLEMIAAEGGAVTEVVFEVQRGERLEEAALAFCARWGFTDWQLDVLVARGHDKVAAGAVTPNVAAVVSDGGPHAAWAAGHEGTWIVLLRGGSDFPAPSDCAFAAAAGAGGLGFAARDAAPLGDVARAAAAAAARDDGFEEVLVVVATAEAPPEPTLQACLTEHSIPSRARSCRFR